MEYQLGQSAKAAALEVRRREALGEDGHMDLIGLMLAKYRCACFLACCMVLQGWMPSCPWQHHSDFLYTCCLPNQCLVLQLC